MTSQADETAQSTRMANIPYDQRAKITIEQPLVILSRQHRNSGGSIGEHEQRELFALHELLDENLRAGFAENAILDHHVDRALGFLSAVGYHDAFARGQSGRLDDDRRARSLDCLECIERIVVIGSSRGGYSGGRHQRLCEPLGCFDFRRCSRWAEDRTTLGLELVNDSERERHFRSHDCQIDVRTLGESEEAGDIVRCDGNTLRDVSEPGIATCADEVDRWIVLLELPRDRMLAAAISNQQHFHLCAGLGERLLYVAQKIVGFLHSAGKAHEPFGDAELSAPFRWNGCMCHRSRMAYEALDATE